VARVYYTAVREWCLITKQDVGDEWCKLPEAYREHLTKIVRHALALNKQPRPKELHEQCHKDALAAGWRAGPFDRKNKTHPDLVSWNALPLDARIKDSLISYVIGAFIEGSYY